MTTVVGFDIGHSMVKAVALSEKGRDIVQFPSVVSPAISLSDEAAAYEAEKESVTIDGQTFFTGETAVTQGSVTSVTGLSKDWIKAPEHAALFVSGLKRLHSKQVPGLDEAMVVMGLPSEFYKHQREPLREIMSKHFSGEIVVQPQPAGPYFATMFETDGSMKANRSMTKESWAVIDVGHFTTDFFLVIRGQRIEVGMASEKGVYLATEHLLRQVQALHNIDIDDLEAAEALKLGKIKNFAEEIDVTKNVKEAAQHVLCRVLDKADSLIATHARKLDGIIVAGGGGSLLYESIKQKWSNAVLAENPRIAIADGFARYGRMLHRARQLTSIAQGG